MLPGLYSVAQFLKSVSQNGFPCDIVKRIAVTKAVYIVGTTLHLHVLHVRKIDELNFILIATHLRLVNEVRVHTNHIHFYLTDRKLHARLTTSHWETVKFFLPYINRGRWVEQEGKREREIKITFDDFLQPVIEAKRAQKPVFPLICDLSEDQTSCISSYHKLKVVHWKLSPSDEEISDKSDFEVDYAHDGRDDRGEEDDDIMMIWGLPFLAPN